MALSKRLNSCLKFTEGFSKLADIGTDHALLPIAAIEEGYVFSALAIDNKIGPYGIAYKNIKQANLSDRIKVILGDGIDKIDDEVDVVVISGMGGSLISNILQSHSIQNVKRFILQPNNDAEVIREMLSKIGFYIIDEHIIAEGNKLYDLIVIEKGNVNYSKQEIMFGPVNIVNKPYLFIKRINEEITRLEALLGQVNQTERVVSIKARIMLLKEAL